MRLYAEIRCAEADLIRYRERGAHAYAAKARARLVRAQEALMVRIAEMVKRGERMPEHFEAIGGSDGGDESIRRDARDGGAAGTGAGHDVAGRIAMDARSRGAAASCA
jgi:hypothetical protein